MLISLMHYVSVFPKRDTANSCKKQKAQNQRLSMETNQQILGGVTIRNDGFTDAEIIRIKHTVEHDVG